MLAKRMKIKEEEELDGEAETITVNEMPEEQQEAIDETVEITDTLDTSMAAAKITSSENNSKIMTIIYDVSGARFENAVHGVPLPINMRTNLVTYMETKDVIKLLGNVEAHGKIHTHVPRGIKENVCYIVDNSRNMQRWKDGLISQFWDDCGAWAHSSSAVTRGIFIRLQHCVQKVFLKNGKYCRLKGRKGVVQHIPVVPQPTPDQVFVLHRYYSKHKLSALYERKITMVSNREDLPYACYEYKGEFPGVAAHGNASIHNPNRYIRLKPEVLDHIKNEVKYKRAKTVYKENLSLDGPRSVQQIMDIKSRQKRKPKVAQLKTQEKLDKIRQSYPKVNTHTHEAIIKPAQNGAELPSRRGAVCFMNTEDLIALLSNAENYMVYDSVPTGIKENVSFLVDNKRNVERSEHGMTNEFWDDCGAWAPGTCAHKKSTFIALPGLPKLREVVYKNNKYFQEKKHRYKPTTLLAVNPQPKPSEVVVLHRYYSKLKLSSDYERRVSWISNREVPPVACYEYKGKYPGRLYHGNSALYNVSVEAQMQVQAKENSHQVVQEKDSEPQIICSKATIVEDSHHIESDEDYIQKKKAELDEYLQRKRDKLDKHNKKKQDEKAVDFKTENDEQTPRETSHNYTSMASNQGILRESSFSERVAIEVLQYEPLLENAIGGTGLPLKKGVASFMDTVDVLGTLARFHSAIVYETIPPGVKENLFFLVDNRKNIELKKNGGKNEFVDDSGPWARGICQIHKRTYLCLPTNKPQQVHLKNNLYCIQKVHNKAIEFVPVDPQPHSDYIIVLHRYYSKHCLSPSYERRITWLSSREDIPIACYEYRGQYPQITSQEGSTYDSSLYVRIKPEMLDYIRQQVQFKSAQDVYNETKSIGGPRNIQQVMDVKYQGKRKMKAGPYNPCSKSPRTGSLAERHRTPQMVQLQVGDDISNIMSIHQSLNEHKEIDRAVSSISSASCTEITYDNSPIDDNDISSKTADAVIIKTHNEPFTDEHHTSANSGCSYIIKTYENTSKAGRKRKTELAPIDAIGGTLLPLEKGSPQFMTLEAVVAALTMVESDHVYKNIPKGIKENKSFIVDNSKNNVRRKSGLKNSFWDDCGPWGRNTSTVKRSVHICLPGMRLKTVVCKNGIYCTERMIRKRSWLSPVDPQPQPDEVYVIYRYYSKHKNSPDYERRITWIDNKEEIPFANYEYKGIYPRLHKQEIMPDISAFMSAEFLELDISEGMDVKSKKVFSSDGRNAIIRPVKEMKNERSQSLKKPTFKVTSNRISKRIKKSRRNRKKAFKMIKTEIE